MDSSSAQTKILRYMVDLGRPEPMVNMMEVLKDDNPDYDQVFELAIEMQNKDFIKIIYCTFPKIINVQQTLIGKNVVRG